MTDLKKLDNAFHAEIGNVENPKGSNNIKYNTDYYGHEVSGDNYAWCCSFIWDIFRLCGLSKLFCNGNKTAYCPFVVTWAKSHNQWVTSGYKLGDILLYDWDNDGRADHIGWCIGVSGTYAKSIEGNSSDMVRMNSQPFSKIMGAYRPNYESSQSENTNLGSETSNLGKIENKPDEYTVKAGDSLWKIGQKFGIPYLDIAKINNIPSPYVIRPGQVLKLKKKDEPIISNPIEESQEQTTDTYTVKTGDSLWKIGQKLKVNYMEIAKLNGINAPYIIHPGQVLKIR